MKLSRIVLTLALALVALYAIGSLDAGMSLDLKLAKREASPFDLVMESRTTTAAAVHSAIPTMTTVLLVIFGLAATTLLLHFGSGFLRQARLTRGKRARNRQPDRQQGRGAVPETRRQTAQVPQLTDGRRDEPRLRERHERQERHTD